MMKSFAIALVFGLAVIANGQASSKSWARYRLFPRSQAEAQKISDSSLSMFSDNVGPETDVVAAPGQMPEVWKLQVPFQFVQFLPDPTRPMPDTDATDYRNEYFNLAELNAKFEEWRIANPSLVQRTQIATTVQNRPVYAYRIYKQGDRDVEHPPKSVVFTFGIHAREWIGPAVGLHVYNRLLALLNGPSTDLSERLTDNCAIYIVPSQNPDGYNYSWTNNRMWRKNRRPNGNNFGVDLNRNYGVGWGLNSGSSGNTGSDTYRGPSAWSEPETSGLRNFCQGLRGIVGFIDFHSYSELILAPWSYQTAQPANLGTYLNIGNQMVTAMTAIGGHAYEVGQTSTLLYLASGTSTDFFHSTHNALAYCIEMRDTGANGFQLPPSQITPTQDENWEAVKVLLDNLL